MSHISILRYAIPEVKLRTVTNALGYAFYTFTERLYIPKRNIYLVRLEVQPNQASTAKTVVLNAVNQGQGGEGQGEGGR